MLSGILDKHKVQPLPPFQEAAPGETVASFQLGVANGHIQPIFKNELVEKFNPPALKNFNKWSRRPSWEDAPQKKKPPVEAKPEPTKIPTKSVYNPASAPRIDKQGRKLSFRKESENPVRTLRWWQ